MSARVTEITTKQDLSRWARAHADSPGIGWSVLPGPGGTMIITEHEGDGRPPGQLPQRRQVPQ